ncbi:hypothetical protein SAMN06272781_5448 [Streptomyces sp. 1222.2]|uniref:Uncharacterized protein n=1 Tax=Streptomyces stelliscabiei TaxID=146820 RepID=A0A8I0TPP0_9ACTN|nr:hypothetical protein [Streptomyces stelliscabiei]SOD77566.1 hypothetical protein SAMN06272781_5448 [Streptomyces sp. 1222.2]
MGAYSSAGCGSSAGVGRFVAGRADPRAPEGALLPLDASTAPYAVASAGSGLVLLVRDSS